MGRLVYGPQERVIEFDDRTLAHVKTVIVAKLRRNEAFLLAWTVSTEHGSGRHSVWIHPAIPLQFQFSGGRLPSINRTWMQQLMESANHGELRITDEPENTDTGSFHAIVGDTTAHQPGP